MHCHNCGIEFKTPDEAYGDVGAELCQSCFLELAEMEAGTGSWYGLAPRKPYHDRPCENDWYEIEPGLWFWPDKEVDGGMGIWEDRGA